jgi:hypothetical protein
VFGSGNELRIPGGDRRGAHNQVRFLHPLWTVADPRFDTDVTKCVERPTRFQVGTGDLVAEPGEQLGEPAHPGPTGADHVDLLKAVERAQLTHLQPPAGHRRSLERRRACRGPSSRLPSPAAAHCRLSTDR